MPTQTAISPETLIATAKSSLQAYNDKDWERLKAVSTPDVVYDEVATGRRTEGIEQCLELFKGWAKAFPDSTATFGDAFAAGDHVVIEVTWRGTHKGLLQTSKGMIPPSGKRIEVRACNVFEVSGDKVSSQRHYFDMMTLLHQLTGGA